QSARLCHVPPYAPKPSPSLTASPCNRGSAIRSQGTSRGEMSARSQLFFTGSQIDGRTVFLTLEVNRRSARHIVPPTRPVRQPIRRFAFGGPSPSNESPDPYLLARRTQPIVGPRRFCET